MQGKCVGRLIEYEMSLGELSGVLWKLIREDTIVWGSPTQAEKDRKYELRKQIFQDSAVPWILSDLTAVLGFYDDLQDIVSFAVWNKRIFLPGAEALERGQDAWDVGRRVKNLPGRFRRCMQGQVASGRSGVAALTRCMCPLPRGEGKRHMKRMGPWDLFLLGPLATLLLRFFPPFAPVMWALLAGQVAGSLLGYGIKLGPIMGAAMELFYRGLAAVGLPFGREHNKWYQLKIARTLQNAEKGWGSARYADWEDRYLVMKGTQLALRDAEYIPAIVIPPQEYPTFDKMIDDPFGVFGMAAKLVGSLVPNLLAYTANDLIGPMISDIGRLFTGKKGEPEFWLNPALHAGLRVAHYHDCPSGDLCQRAIEDALAMEEWAEGEGIDIQTETRWWKLQEVFSQWLFTQGRSAEAPKRVPRPKTPWPVGLGGKE